MIKLKVYENLFKRPLDFLISLIALLFLSPLLITISILVVTKLSRPVLFTQSRPGLHGQIFKMYKFRTMTDERDENGMLLPDKTRLTAFGNFLRSTSLDELPGLLNVLKGEMSLIGPRPLLAEYLPLYSKEQLKRHNVRPGLSGLAQINGRNLLTWEEKFELDIEYVENVTLFQDIKILVLTLKKVIIKEGISATDHVTMEPFKGSD